MLSFNFEKIVRRSNRIKRASSLKSVAKRLTERKAAMYLVGFLVLAGVALGGFKLGTFGAGQAVDIAYNFDYKGISVHTKAENIAPASSRNGTATAKAGDTVKFTLTVNNPDSTAKIIDVRFSTPAGFKYQKMVAGPAGSVAVVAPKLTCADTATIAVGFSGDMIWCDYSAKPGDSYVVLETLAP